MYWAIVIFGLGILVALHELGHFWLARAMGMKVLRFSVGFLHPIFSHTSAKTGIVYQIGALPLGGFVQVKGMNPFEDGAYEDADSYQMKPAWKRGLVILAGPVANLLIAVFPPFALLTASGLPTPVNESRVGDVVPDGPAEKAGLRKGDRIVEIDGTPVSTWEALAGTMHDNPDKRLNLMVERDGRRFFVSVTPKNVDGTGLIGIGIPSVNVSLPIGEAAVFSVTRCARILKDTVTSLARLVAGREENVQAVGPPGIVKMGRRSLDAGANYFLDFLAYISLMLFLFNLLPVPALDGGRTVFLFYEIITGRRVNKKFDAAINTAFFMLLMALLIFVSLKELIFT